MEGNARDGYGAAKSVENASPYPRRRAIGGKEGTRAEQVEYECGKAPPARKKQNEDVHWDVHFD
jgi:hypothetical protein